MRLVSVADRWNAGKLLILYYFKVTFELSQQFAYCAFTENLEVGGGSFNDI